MDDLGLEFGRRIRALRKERGLSQEELAHRSDLHWTYLGGIERGERKPTLFSIGKLAKGLKMTLSELFNGVRNR